MILVINLNASVDKRYEMEKLDKAIFDDFNAYSDEYLVERESMLLM